ncbi:glycoside hydrolase family 3 C-terminal domain-containing protein [Nesterenkonia suensis]
MSAGEENGTGPKQAPSGDMTADLTLVEKAALLSGDTVWETRAIPRAGVRRLFLSDGPHGIRKQSGEGDHLGLHNSEPATCFPPAATVANSWDPALGEAIGQAIGAEAAAHGVDVVLGPGLNIKRSPLCGRNFEYFSEDPLLSGAFAAAYVRGIQSAGVAACPKHFAANSQETRRMVTDSVVDERTLREIYLAAFEKVVREAHPRTIMSSYNRINGAYAHENAHLLTQVLRKKWGFDGVVVSDWGGSNDAVAAARAGGTLEMPSPGWDSAQQLVEAVASGQLPEEDLTARAREMVQLAHSLPEHGGGEVPVEKHHELARRAAAESAVLLKNTGDLLPLAPGTRTAVIGDFALTPRYQGAGSSLVNPTRLSTGVEATTASGLDVVGVAQGFVRHGGHDPALAEEARGLAATADVVLLWLGLDEISESEGLDRRHLRLPENQLRLLEELAAVGTPVVVVLSGGSAVEVGWMDRADAVLHGYLAGQAGADGLLQVITGEVTPSGRLAETYPRSLADTPTAGRFPEPGDRIDYLEGPLVGYRWYTSAGVSPALPFGHGLSYTTFRYADLRVDQQEVRFTLTNTGDRPGAEVTQVYLQRESPSGVLRPVRELAGFAKAHLAPGESREIVISLDDWCLRHWDQETGDWQVEAGTWSVLLGASIEDIRCEASVEAAGTVPAGTGSQEQLAALVERVRRAAAAAAQNRTASSRTTTPARPRRELGLNDPLAELAAAHSPVGRAAAALLRRMLARAEARGRPDLNLLFLSGMPIRALAKMSGGGMSLEMAQKLLVLLNGRHLGGTAGLIGAALRHRRRARATRRTFDDASAGRTIRPTVKEKS